MARGGNQIQTLIVVDAKTGKAVKGMKLVQNGVRNVRKSTRRTTQSTKELRKAQEDLNKRAQEGSYATKEGIEGVRDLLQNGLSPELSRAATAFSGLEKVAKVMPGPIGLIAAGVGLAAVAIHSMVKEAREARTQLVQAFGPERGAELDKIRSDLDVAASSVIEVAHAADEAGISTEHMAVQMAVAVKNAEAAGREGKDGLTKLAEIIRKTTSDAQRLAAAFSLVGSTIKSMDLEGNLKGTGLDTDGLNKSAAATAAAIQKQIKAIKERIDVEDQARVSAKRTMNNLHNRRFLRKKAAVEYQAASKARKKAIAEIALQEERLEKQRNLLRTQRRAAESLRSRAPELRRMEEQRQRRLLEDELVKEAVKQKKIADAKKAAQDRKRAAAAAKAAQARRAEQAKARAHFRTIEEQMQLEFQSRKETIQAKIDAIDDETSKKKELLRIDMERLNFEKAEHDIVKKGINIRERLTAARLQMETKIGKIREKSEKERELERDNNIASAMSFIENERAKAGIAALMETAKAWASWPDLASVASHGMAAAQYALVAGTGKPTLPGTGGSSDAPAPSGPGLVGGQPSGPGSSEAQAQNIHINFGSGFAVGNSQQFGTMVNKAVKSATNTGYAQKAGV